LRFAHLSNTLLGYYDVGILKKLEGIAYSETMRATPRRD